MKIPATGESAPLVSVVTPFYNTRKFLGECIESVLRQTYQNWEYVLVDNQSMDGSTELAANYATRYPKQIRLIQTESFLSQVRNYNFALSCISPESKYCKMVQADDWIFPDCIRRMVEVAEAHPAVGIVGAYELEGEYVHLDGLPYPSTEVVGRDVCRRYFLQDQYLFGTPTSLLFRSDLIRTKTPFYEERFAPFEDAGACFDVLATHNYGFVHQVLTHSRRDSESILSTIRPFQFLLFTKLAHLVRHGRAYLSEDEYETCLSEAEREYFFLLGTRVLTGAPREFWDFHRRSLASVDYALDWRLLSKWSLRALLDHVGNPKRTLGLLLRSRRQILAGLSRDAESHRGHFF